MEPAGESHQPPALQGGAPLEELRLWRRLHIRLTALYGGIILLALTLLGIAVYLAGVRREMMSLQRNLLTAARSLAVSVDAVAVDALPGDQRELTLLHKVLLRRFSEVARSDADVESIYLLKPTKEPTRLRFVVDYVKEGDAAKPGDIYDASEVPVMLKGFTQPAVESQPVSDSFGTTLSGYAPVKTRRGESVAVVGVDVDASRINEIKRDVLRNVALTFGFTTLLLGSVAVLVGRNLRGPLTRIMLAATAISQGDLTTRVGLNRGDELGLMSQYIDLMAEQLQDREFVRETFGRYLSAKIASEILRQGNQLALGGEERVVTILFMDLRGYSTISEQMSPPQVVVMMNEYLGAMNESIEKHRGCVIEFVGDAIFAVFGAPQYLSDHADHAVRCAIEMQQSLEQLNLQWEGSGIARAWKDRGMDHLTARVGIHTGPVVAGNLGSHTRMKYSVIGDTVNVAARLESLNKELGTDILISRDVYVQLSVELADGAIEKATRTVKGRETPVRIYSIPWARSASSTLSEPRAAS